MYSEAVTAYLESIRRPGPPSQKELDCLERIKEWEDAMRFIEEMKGSGGVL